MKEFLVGLRSSVSVKGQKHHEDNQNQDEAKCIGVVKLGALMKGNVTLNEKIVAKNILGAIDIVT